MWAELPQVEQYSLVFSPVLPPDGPGSFLETIEPESVLFELFPLPVDAASVRLGASVISTSLETFSVGIID